MTRRSLAMILVLGTLIASASWAAASRATAPPVGPLPSGPTATIQTQVGEAVAFALPHRSGGKVWRVARAFDGHILRQISEADVGDNVVLIFSAVAPGTTVVSFGLTRGERAHAYESRRFTVTVHQ